LGLLRCAGVEEFAKEETTDVFFASTKLFQSADVHLRRLTYLVIKELHIGTPLLLPIAKAYISMTYVWYE
jgi:hypothetical protein